MNTDPVDPDVQRGYDRASYGVTKDDLENMGERAVRDAHNFGKFEHPGHKTFAFVSDWLADKDFVRVEESNAVARAATAAATAAALSASSANALARRANIIAAIAVAIAAIGIIKWW
ncbi:MAG: hypothetical protein Q8L02_04595 [Candidatus Nitrotoga sp.]|nr:hypothetical protein [Candidatus Nitrotoga sp.]